MLSRKMLIQDLRRLGLSSGDLVMLHVSTRAVGKILGGPDEIHQAIMDIIAPHGTLAMYVGCETEFEMIGRRMHTTPAEEFVLENCPAFDPKLARARHDFGLLAEYFRTWPNIVCSENPGARIAALGKRAIWLTADHPLNYGYGAGSPLAKLYENEGKVLLLGSDLDQVTLLHFAEDIAPIKEKRIRYLKFPLIKNNIRVWVDIEEFDTSIGIRKWPNRFFAQIMQKFLEAQQMKPIQVGHADCYLLDAKKLVDFAVPYLKEQANHYPV